MTEAAITFMTAPRAPRICSHAPEPVTAMSNSITDVRHNPLADRAARTLPAGGARHIVRALVREPLLHFAVLGGLIFAADARLRPAAHDDHVIVVTKALRKSFIDGFSEDKDREPSAAEVQRMIDSWVASEILYKEGKAAGVDRGDQTIRDRIAYKLQLLIFDQIKVDRPDLDQLRVWFAANHARFDEPARVGFYMTPGTDEATARRELADITSQHENPDLQNQTRAILARPVASIAASFGAAFLHDLQEAPLDTWTVLKSNEGWHAVRVDSRRPGTLARLEDVMDEASRIYHDDEVRKRAWEAVGRLKAGYTVRYEP